MDQVNGQLALQLGQGGRIRPEDTVVLLEDSPVQIEAVRRDVEGIGFALLVAGDWQTAVNMAECGAQFFILDIKMGEEPERVKAGLLALNALRARYGDGIFVAVLSALIDEHESALATLRPNLTIEKSSSDRGFIKRIVAAYKKWVRLEHERMPARSEFPEESSQSSEFDTLPEEVDAVDCFPSDALALRIVGATTNELGRMLRERRTVASALGLRPPQLMELKREIGERMRAELRGALRELGDRARTEGRAEVELSNGPLLAGELIRCVFRLLPITYGADDILAQLRRELEAASVKGFGGEWGLVKLVDERVVLAVNRDETYEGA